MLLSMTTWLQMKMDRRAVTALEYGLIAGVIVATILVGFGVLANNGGPTDTLLPAPTSPAVGAIPDPTTLAFPAPFDNVQVCSRNDQRAVASLGMCTIGAVEQLRSGILRPRPHPDLVIISAAMFFFVFDHQDRWAGR